MPWEVIVADDHPLYREALAQLLARAEDFAVVAAVETLPEALDALARKPVDLVVLDVGMPGMDGLSGVARLRAGYPETRIVLISGNLERTLVGPALAGGVAGLLPKVFEPEILIAALRLVMAGAVYVPHDLAAPAEPPNTAPAAPAVPGGVPSLSPRELDVLRRLVRGETHKEIARALDLAEVTVKLHTRRIVAKLGARNRAAAIAQAVREGLVDPEE